MAVGEHSLHTSGESHARTRRRRVLLTLAVAALAVAALLKLPMEASHILWDERGAKDLRYYFEWAHDWAAGRNVYLRADLPEYPPGSLPVLYGIAGWLDWPRARLLIGTLSLGGAALLVCIALRETRPRTGAEAMLIALLLASNNGTGTALGNGQLALIVIPLLLGAVLLLRRRAVAWRTDLVAAACMSAALVKPSLAVPFLWLGLIFPAGIRLRPMLLTAAGYAALSILALWVMDVPLSEALLIAVRNGLGTAVTARDPNMHFLLTKLGLESFMLFGSAVALLGLGAWVYRNRASDVWLLLAVTALIARIWTYHRVYDDVLILLPQIALWRIAATETADRGGRIAAVLLALNALVVVAPGNMTAPPDWLQRAVLGAQAIVWSATLAMLARYAARAGGTRVAWIDPTTRRPPTVARW
jgi:hypothetical protein